MNSYAWSMHYVAEAIVSIMHMLPKLSTRGGLWSTIVAEAYVHYFLWLMHKNLMALPKSIRI